MRTLLLSALLVIMAAAPAAAQGTAAGVPEQLRVTLGAEPNTFVIHWAIAGQPYLSTERPVVEASWTGSPTKSVPAARVGALAAGGSVISQATAVPITFYGATIGPIPAGEAVTYRVGSPERGYSDTRTIRMVPNETQGLRFVAYGDIGVDSTDADGKRKSTATEFPAFEVRDRVIQEKPDLVIIPGDLAYQNSQQGWASFLRFMDPLSSVVPFMPTLGNHEWDSTLGYAQYLNSYVLPGDEKTFLFRAGPVTFIALNSDEICSNHSRASTGSPPHPCDDGAQGKFNSSITDRLVELLKQAQNDTTPWTVVYHHHPAYSHGRHGSDFAVQTYFTPIYEAYGVDLVVTAHDHLYSRSYPIREGRSVINGTNDYTKGMAPLYVVTGGGGRSLYTPPDYDPPEWYAAGGKFHHHVRINVTPTMLTLEAVLASNGTVVDQFTITQRALSEPSPTPEGVPAPPVALALTMMAALALALARRRVHHQY
jgi:acid phosphatase type 7